MPRLQRRWRTHTVMNKQMSDGRKKENISRCSVLSRSHSVLSGSIGKLERRFRGGQWSPVTD